MAKAKKKKASRKRPAASRKLNPAKFRRVTKTTGWLPASAVKVVKRRGHPDQLLIRKPRRRAKKGKR